jgi:HNH endonuclease
LAISKRLRYEVLRRDNYTCRYCGAFAPLAVLVVDHVTPRKHGGRDALENLVTACQDCNSGKSATMPESWLVDEVERAAHEWRGLPTREPDEDDLYEMEVYQDCLYVLEGLTAGEALRWIARAYIAAMPYRPTHSELIRCAGMLAREAAAKAGVRA